MVAGDPARGVSFPCGRLLASGTRHGGKAGSMNRPRAREGIVLEKHGDIVAVELVGR